LIVATDGLWDVVSD